MHRYFKGVFTTAVFSPFKLNPSSFSQLVQFICAGMNTLIALGCRSKQPHGNALEEVVSEEVRFQMNTRGVHLNKCDLN